MDLSKLITAEAKAAEALEAARAKALADVMAWIDRASVPLTAGVPMQEQIGWPVKEAAAVAVLAGTATDAQQQMIGAEAAITGEAIPALCETIIGKATAYHGAVGIISGLRRAVEAGLVGAKTPAACEKVSADAIAAAESAIGA